MVRSSARFSSLSTSASDRIEVNHTLVSPSLDLDPVATTSTKYGAAKAIGPRNRYVSLAMLVPATRMCASSAAMQAPKRPDNPSAAASRCRKL